MKTRILMITWASAAASTLSGCALDAASAQRATAIAVGNNAVAPEQVKISDTRAGNPFAPAVHWHASAPNGEFDCSAIPRNEALTQTVCVRK